MTNCPWWTVLFPPAITAAAILGVGYWVNTTIRRRNHRDVLVFSYLQEVTRQIHKLTTEAVDAHSLEDCTLALRRLSNEVQHLLDLHSQFTVNSTSPQKLLDTLVLELKWYLTESGTPVEEENREVARQAGYRLRNEVLQIVLCICDTSPV